MITLVNFLSIFSSRKVHITHQKFSEVNVTRKALECVDTNVFNSALCWKYILFIANLH